MDTMKLLHAGETADRLIAKEVSLQDAMWGVGNERADATKGQMVQAALTQTMLVVAKRNALRGDPEGTAMTIAGQFYPKGWGGFRDYGSDVANLVVAAAYLRSEVKRRVANGEDTTRSNRTKDQPYDGSVKPAFTTAEPGWQDKI